MDQMIADIGGSFNIQDLGVKCWESNSIGVRGNVKEGLEVNSDELLLR